MSNYYNTIVTRQINVGVNNYNLEVQKLLAFFRYHLNLRMFIQEICD